jgi:hypothetical protein
MVPRTASWEELGFGGLPDTRPNIRTGEELFARLTPYEQSEVLGVSKYESYASGKIELRDLVEHTHHPRWGDGTREASLRNALSTATRRQRAVA